MNKTDLINQLAERLDGDKKKAQVAVEGFIDLVQREVQKGRNVSISGFGVFEKRARAARTARNPRTGEAVKVKKTNVPAFRPGKYFKDVIAGTVKLPKAGNTLMTARAAAAAARASATAGGAKSTTTRSRAAAKPAGTTTRTRAAAKPAGATGTSATGTTTRTRAASKTTAAAPKTTRAPRATGAKAAAAPKAAAAKTTAAAKAPARRATAKATPASS
jgi:DNA-binding protein HU-beta